MKRVILIVLVVATSLALKAQTPAPNSPQEPKTVYSFAWGLFKSKEYPNDKTAVFDFEFEFPKPSTAFSEMPLDITKYEKKTLLWGAIQWTEKKKQPSTLNIQRNDN